MVVFLVLVVAAGPEMAWRVLEQQVTGCGALWEGGGWLVGWLVGGACRFFT